MTGVESHRTAHAESDVALTELARLYRVQTSYRDAFGSMRDATPDALVAMLRVLGADIDSASDAGAVLQRRRHEIADSLAEPVVVAWEGQPVRIALRVAQADDARFRAVLVHEDGRELRTIEGRVADLPTDEAAARIATFEGELDFGYHTVRIEVAGRACTITVFRAPTRAWQPANSRQWGLFAPTYGLRRRDDTGCGDLGDLRTLFETTRDLGGTCVATLPLLASFLDEPFDPSPYAPASRFFWNELFLDPESLPELRRSAAARARLDSAEYRLETEELRRTPLVDYRRTMRVKRALLEDLSRAFFDGSPDETDRADLERYMREHPLAEDYARFRATVDRERAPWQRWPARQRGGELRAGDYDDVDLGYHLYAQWRTAHQLERLGDDARASGRLGLYLDLPLGVHAAAYDTWRMPELFLGGCSAGAPPDALFTGGQSWGLAPMHPEGARASGYRNFAEAVRTHLRCAGALRIDHVMGLHRLYCIPDGIDRREGIYVGYRADELYALLAIESHRHRCLLIGEDLGTVPPEVRECMHSHGIHPLHVLQYEIGSDGRVEPPGAGVCASVNTHDMPPFAGWWEGADIADRLDLGLVDAAGAERERASRRELVEAVRRAIAPRGDAEDRASDLEILRALLVKYADSAAALLIVSLEDLWLEREPQNVPGTGAERNNWRRKLRHPLEETLALPELRATLGAISNVRRHEET